MGNPLERPPLEIAVKGIEAIREYFRQLAAQGIDRLFEAKLLIVGEPGAEKQQSANEILETPIICCGRTRPPPEVSTSSPGNSRRIMTKLLVNLWDFGGQAIYHAAHQFFLTKRSLYALVADTRKEDTDFYYWLNAVELLSDKARC